jgi:hypothetical protein
MTHTVIVWYCDEFRSWAVTRQDEDGIDLGESDWHGYKYQAVAEAKRIKSAGKCQHIEITTKAA